MLVCLRTWAGDPVCPGADSRHAHDDDAEYCKADAGPAVSPYSAPLRNTRKTGNRHPPRPAAASSSHCRRTRSAHRANVRGGACRTGIAQHILCSKLHTACATHLQSGVLRRRPVCAQERKSNKLKDFLDVAGPLGVTHMLSFSNTGAFALSAASWPWLRAVSAVARESARLLSPEQRQRTRCVATAAELGPYTHLPHIVSDAGVVAEHAYRTVLQRVATSCTVLQRWHVVLLIMEFRSRHVLAHPSVPAWADADLPRRPVHARCAAVLSSTLLPPVHARCAAAFASRSATIRHPARHTLPAACNTQRRRCNVPRVATPSVGLCALQRRTSSRSPGGPSRSARRVSSSRRRRSCAADP